jgi:hypothetical protein
MTDLMLVKDQTLKFDFVERLNFDVEDFEIYLVHLMVVVMDYVDV